ncbi:hypothetical protein LZZ85_27570 [Terrimonas sp. NA20]|uniref:Lipoprotein n=1 Tax=Terrimonas ginsenosidimutans TaxID=2908004 RepID=A0ABS9L0I8_9BACT|nr:hypothetical protein [Terrimonas ginsenosidimutans]MCG2618093.1 hypothetical protein [Terrimonas ginsenosidimutans]
MRLRFPALCVGLALLLVACSKDEAGSYKEPSVVRLNARIPLSTYDTATVSFDEVVSDSRCPANSLCSWAGIAIARFTLRAGQKELPFMLSIMPGYPKQDTIINGYVIELSDLQPYPGMAGSDKKAPVQAELRIFRLR